MPAIELLYHAGLKENCENIAVFNAQPHALLQDLCGSVKSYALQQSFKPFSDAIKALGLEDNIEIHGEFDVILFFPHKNKLLTLKMMAKAMFCLSENGKIIMACANHHGAKSYEKALKQLSPTVLSNSKSKCRIFSARKTSEFNEPVALAWLQKAQMQQVPSHGLYSEPGLFSWDKADMGSQLLLQYIPALTGHGMDLCCGYGLLATTLLPREKAIESMHLVDAEAMAVACAKKNTLIWQDKLQYHCLDAQGNDLPKGLNWVVCNPPFHTGQDINMGLGQAIVAQACRSLQRGGDLYLVANRKLPYEAVLQQHLRSFKVLIETQGFKIIHGVR